MTRIYSAILLLLFFVSFSGFGQAHVSVSIDGSGSQKAISPYIFGRNNNLSDNKSSPLTSVQWQNLKDLGIHMFRENGGNNATKYNWRLKLSSHPDWYNNVYAHDWDYAAQSLGANIPGAQGMWAFQLIGWAARTSQNNFADYAFNQSQWWSGVNQNLAGGGIVNTTGGSQAKKNGNPNLYLEPWNADSTTGILKHWFGQGGVGLDSNKIRYWSMDNEIEIWNGTHDDVDSVPPTAEQFMQLYFAVAKKARALYPGIKLMGPVPANEWQWYNYPGGKISYKGNSYVWLEYFILRCAEEEQATGIRLLDVLDLHFYPGESSPADIVQLYRIFFDQTYNYPGANGVKVSGPNGWDNSLTKEYIFKRCNDWLTKYMGPNNGVKLSLSETGFNNANPNVSASLYASMLGEFARQGVEVFTPWSWNIGMSEVIHLFSKYSKAYYVSGTSSDENTVSAYPSINANKDSLVIYFVNRHLTDSRVADIELIDFPVKDGLYDTYTLSNLPANETFVSNSTNALKKGSLQITGNKPSITLPALSVTALVLKRENFVSNQFGDLAASAEAENGVLTGVTVSTVNPGYSGTGYVTGFDNPGDKVTVSMDVPENGLYKLVITYNGSQGDKYNDLLINGAPTASIHFPAYSGYTYAEAGSYYLNKGSNTFTILKNWGWTDIDKFELYPTTKHIYNFTTNLVDSLANDTTKALYKFLLNQFGSRIISGQTDDYYDSAKILSGYSPMIRNSDLYNYTPGYPYLWNGTGHSFGIDDNGNVEKLIAWYKSTGGKGIVAYQWHWCSPIGGVPDQNTFYTQYTTFDITKAVTPGTLEDSLVLRDIDLIAVQLQKFQAAGIPILWRPLHEAGGGWFWWGAKGPAACKQLYNIMYDRLTNYHHLHNLIWVWSTPEADWYPGNDKVDIIGYDSYPGNYNYGNQKAAFDGLYNLTNGQKLITMSENGPIPSIDSCLNYDAPWSYFMSWSNLVRQQNSLSHIQEVFANSNVLKLESTNSKTNRQWRSALYPENWVPGFKDSEGRFLHDFSYAGYHSGLDSIPKVAKNIINVTLPPYNADNTGSTDVTSIIQQALDDAGNAGGGVVYLPAGTYQISAADTAEFALTIRTDSTILRGAGNDSTFLFNAQASMRNKDIILVKGQDADWFDPNASGSNISSDIIDPTRLIPVQSSAGFHKGDLVVIASTPTAAFADEHGMTGKWTAEALRGVAFLRRIDTVDEAHNLLVIDAPTRYFLKTRDLARVYHVKNHIMECGIENLSVGNMENTNSGWADEDYAINGTGAFDVSSCNAIEMRYAQNCWVKNVHTYKPSVNTDDIQLLSNGILLNFSRFITVDSCLFQKPQYMGEGGNGYMYTLESNNCLIRDSKAANSRQNFNFQYPYSNGNVILRSVAKNSSYGSNFSRYLSMANLFDQCTLDSDYISAVYSSLGDSVIDGYTSTQSVFYNTSGEAYQQGKSYIIDSRQFGNGYIIGTSGPANNAVISPVEGMINGFYFNTRPTDFLEGLGEGQDLVPASLYLDQLEKRKQNPILFLNYSVKIAVKDQISKSAIANCQVVLGEDSLLTDSSGIASYIYVPQVFSLSVNRKLYISMVNPQVLIHSDTTLTVYLSKQTYNLTIKIINSISKKAVGSATIILSGLSKTTSTPGTVLFSMNGGNLNYSISQNYYQTKNGNLYIFSDSTIIIELTQSLADMRFTLKEGSSYLNAAFVKIENDSLVTNGIGLAVFSHYTVPYTYHYYAAKSGYYTVEGDIDLLTDTAINIAMSRLTSVAGNTTGSLNIWPNPAVDVLNCDLPAFGPAGTIRIYDMTGRTVYLSKLKSRAIHIDVKDLKPGVYLIEERDNKLLLKGMFIKK